MAHQASAPLRIAVTLVALGACSSDTGAAGSSDAGAEDAGLDGDGFNRYSVDFAGEGRVVAGEVADYFGSEPLATFTIAGWVKSRDVSESGGFIKLNLAGTFSDAVQFYFSGSRIAFRTPSPMPGGTPVVYGPVDDPTQWHHVVGVFDAGELRIYIDGSMSATEASATPTVSVEGPVALGIFTDDPALAINGWLDEVAMWSSALSDAAVRGVYNDGIPADLLVDVQGYDASGALVAYFRMGDDDAGEGTSVTDLAGRADGTLLEGARFDREAP